MRSFKRSGGWLVLLSLASACNCGKSGLENARSELHVAPATVDFGNVYVGATPARTFTVFNSGVAPDTVNVASLPATDGGGGASTLAGGAPRVARGGAGDGRGGFAPPAPGRAATAVSLTWSTGTATVTLEGNALAWPSCVASTACETAAFDPNTGVCTQTAIPDGRACDGGDVCLVNTACAGGRCLGMLNPCSDHDACTTDYCIEGEGCHHADSSAQCDGTDPCQIYACDPASGCTQSEAPNGTPCSSTESCQTAKVCLFGQCTGVAVPNGTPCALPWAPCVSDATCQSGQCDSPTAEAYTPGQVLWHLDAGDVSAGAGFAVDSAGTSYPVSYGADAGWQLLAIDS